MALIMRGRVRNGFLLTSTDPLVAVVSAQDPVVGRLFGVKLDGAGGKTRTLADAELAGLQLVGTRASAHPSIHRTGIRRDAGSARELPVASPSDPNLAPSPSCQFLEL